VKDLLRATWLLFATHLPRHLRARRTWIVLAVALFPAGLAFLVTSLSKKPAPQEVAVMGGWLALMQVVVPLTGLVLGSAAVAEEVEDRTITYLTTRPMPRPALLLGRWAAIAVVLTTILGLSTWLFLAAASRAKGAGPPLDSGVVWPLVQAVLVGGLVYSALAAALGAFVRHPILIGLGYAFAIEGFLANLPGKNQMLTVQHHLRSLIASSGTEGWAKAKEFAGVQFEPGATAAVVLASILVAALVLGCWRLTRREFLLTS
jgi:ABC-2 type transport system permease protein